MNTTRLPRRAQHVSSTAFLRSVDAESDDPGMRRQVVFRAAIEIAEVLARAGRIAVIERELGVEYRLDCDLLMGPPPR
jgi:hypothetical protein